MVSTRRSQRLANQDANVKKEVADSGGDAKKPLKESNSKGRKGATKKGSSPPPASRGASRGTTKRKAASAAGGKKNKKTKTKLTGLTKAIADPTSALGVVDPESKIENGWICSIRDESVGDEVPADVMLAFVDPAKHHDKYYVLQLIETKDGSGKENDNDDDNDDALYVVYTRWGRTGTSGQATRFDFPNGDWDGAVAKFESVFSSKTGHSWKDRNEPTEGDKYRLVNQNLTAKQGGYSDATWQYYVDDGVDGKKTGWYDYDEDGSRQVERLHSEFVNTAANGGNQYFATRMIDSGSYTYAVDLVKMTQTNSTHPNHTSRRIRRCPADAKPGARDDGEEETVPAAPSSSSPYKVPSAASLPAIKSKKTGGSHPVDTSLEVQGESAANYTVVQGPNGLWYDSVLNQCNIGNNNNKYYRLQLLTDGGGSYYVWMRWGRVGEPARKGSSKFEGPFSNFGGAKSVFCKKYRDKTKNSFGADEFVEYTGKYVPIEIDNDVEVTDEMKVDADATNVTVQYAKSALDAKTKDFVQVLFSKEMQNEALVSFNLDLKRLPLGVPSQAQIQSGVDILSRIEEKLNGDSSIRESYQELSSRFYTAIPHSFGRQRPPTIQDKESLQSRFDMTNILLDMYETNQTMRRIEGEQKKKQEKDESKNKMLPNPVDQHYESLNADLTHVDPKSAEFATVKKYFDATKHQGSRAQLLDVWTVNRHNEGGRFAQYDGIDNRHLLWHGTNIAVVAPILTSGLRIMPHSGGRVGAGIYLANLQQKSAQYTSGYGAKYAAMFLAEAPLGRQHVVNSDGPHASRLRSAPSGFDSVRAIGRFQPSKFDTLTIDGKPVSVPSGPPRDANVQSSFSHDELLVYNEAQVRIRYVVTVRM